MRASLPWTWYPALIMDSGAGINKAAGAVDGIIKEGEQKNKKAAEAVKAVVLTPLKKEAETKARDMIREKVSGMAGKKTPSPVSVTVGTPGNAAGGAHAGKETAEMAKEAAPRAARAAGRTAAGAGREAAAAAAAPATLGASEAVDKTLKAGKAAKTFAGAGKDAIKTLERTLPGKEFTAVRTIAEKNGGSGSLSDRSVQKAADRVKNQAVNRVKDVLVK